MKYISTHDSGYEYTNCQKWLQQSTDWEPFMEKELHPMGRDNVLKDLLENYVSIVQYPYCAIVSSWCSKFRVLLEMVHVEWKAVLFLTCNEEHQWLDVSQPFGRTIISLFEKGQCFGQLNLLTLLDRKSMSIEASTYYQFPDMASHDRLRSCYMQPCHGVVIGFSVANRSSFNNVFAKWIPEVQRVLPQAPYIVVANKVDLTTSPKGPEYYVCSLENRFQFQN